MDFDLGSKRTVSLGGARRAGKTRQEVLDAAKSQRQQRAVSVAPARCAASVQRLFRGFLHRKRVAVLLRSALREAITSLPLICSASIERRLILLWKCSSSDERREDTLLTEACCGALLQWASAASPEAEASIAAPACACRSAEPSFVTPDDWSRRSSRLLPALLHAVGRKPGGNSASTIALTLCTSERAWAPCCRARGVGYGYLATRPKPFNLLLPLGGC